MGEPGTARVRSRTAGARRRPGHRPALVVAAALGAAVALAACGHGPAVGGGAAASAGSTVPSATTTPSPTAPPEPEPEPVTLSFAGDVHFEGSSRAALTGGLTAITPALSAADLTVVNLETAVTDRGTPAPQAVHLPRPVRRPSRRSRRPASTS